MPRDSDAYYRRQAHDAEAHADRAISPDDRASWLRLAQQWLALIRHKPAQTAAEEFDDAVQQQGTHQDVGDNPQ